MIDSIIWLLVGTGVGGLIGLAFGMLLAGGSIEDLFREEDLEDVLDDEFQDQR